MSLPKYQSFEEKAEYFNLYFPKNINQLEQYFQALTPKTYTRIIMGIEYSGERSFLFRGVNDASFKMYSSIHRCLDLRTEKYMPKLSLEELMSEIKSRFQANTILLEEYRNQMPEGSISTDPSIWAFIQHFGGPSPLLDFTSDIESALFFAFDKLKPSEPDNDMSKYVSLFIFEDNPVITGETTSMYADSSETGTEMVIRHEQATGETINTYNFVREILTQPLEQIAWGSLVYGNKKSRHRFRIPDAKNSEVFSAVDNINISAQMGSFFQGNIIESKPLEIAHNLRSSNPPRIYGSCIEIPKSMIEEIRKNYKIPSQKQIYPEKEGSLKSLYSAMKELWIPPKTSQNDLFDHAE